MVCEVSTPSGYSRGTSRLPEVESFDLRSRENFVPIFHTDAPRTTLKAKAEKRQTTHALTWPLSTDDEEAFCQNGTCENRPQTHVQDHRLVLLSLRELPTTLTEDSAIAAAAMIGDRRSPKEG